MRPMTDKSFLSPFSPNVLASAPMEIHGVKYMLFHVSVLCCDGTLS